ncbi:MAG: right-handed parallel beta-helix repeat-containing protein [Sedimentisphaerales bacterium]|nr:right-handed parallel beta-helix repeat-containing protein [Sedimentisphaerales bacterium]
MKNVLVASVVLAAFASASLSAAVLKVPGEYPSIQEAIDASSHGDTVLVSPGLYFERIDFNGKNIVVTSEDPNDSRIVGYTILNAEGQGSVVTFQNGETSRAVLTGFTLTGGVGTLQNSGSNYKYFYGAGIYCTYGSPTITHNVIANNLGAYSREEVRVDLGGGSYYTTYNYVYTYGGGIYCSGSATITNNLIYRNTAYRGGGIYCGYSHVANNIVYDNSAVYGGGVSIYGGRLANNTIVGNDAGLDPDYGIGGNLYAEFSYDPTSLVVVNNIICNAKSGGGIYWYEATEDAIRYNNVWDNLPSNYVMEDPRTYDYVYDGKADWTNQHGNISEDPLLLTAWNQRYHLDAGSPCVSAGDPDFAPQSGETDIDGDPRVFAVRVDIGADERVGYVRPLAQAGADQHVLTPEPIALDGTTSYFSDPAGAKTFQWAQSEGAAVDLDDPTAAQPVFTPPGEGWYKFQLVVGDDQYTSGPDEVLVVVGNERPVADAGLDKLWEAPGGVGLDASGSHDADPPDELAYVWTQIDGPTVSLSDPNSASPYFVCQEPGIYQFRLVVNDGFVDSEPDVVRIEAAPFTTDAEVFDVTDEPMMDCFYAAVSGTMIACAGMDYSGTGTWDIYCTDSKTGETSKFDAGPTDTKPKIDGGVVVWASGANDYYYEMCTSLCLADLAKGKVRRLLNARSNESYGYPAISGNKIAYLRHYDVDTGDMLLYSESPYDICVADISDLSNPTYFTIAEQAGHGYPYPSDNYYYADEDFVDVSGDIVVWEGDGDIYGADISDLDNIKVFPICTAPERQYDPAVSGHVVVWTDERNDIGDIYGADISDPDHIREFEVYVARGWQLRPDIDGALIAFCDGDDYSGYIRTYCYSPQYGPVAYPLPGFSYGAAPRIDGASIAWRNGSYQVSGARVEFGYGSMSGPIQNATTGQTYDYIQHALFGATDGDVIVLPEGAYREKLRFSGRNVTLTSTDPTDPAVRAATVLTGEGQLVMFADGETEDCLFTGFTITGGSFGISCNQSSPTIRLCDVTGNRDAGIKLWGASQPTISLCDITNNGIGVEMWAMTGSRNIRHNYPTLRNCLIAGNRAEGIFGSNPTVENCTIADNLGMGVSGTRPIIANSIVYFNNGVSADVEGKLQLTVSYSDIEGGAAGVGNIDADPLFRAPGDYHLKSQGWSWDALSGQWSWDDETSPCIDAADPAAALGEELPCNAGDPFSERAVNNRLNMGLYGGTVEASLAPR